MESGALGLFLHALKANKLEKNLVLSQVPIVFLFVSSWFQLLDLG
jgi:hypothetical protein